MVSNSFHVFPSVMPAVFSPGIEQEPPGKKHQLYPVLCCSGLQAPQRRGEKQNPLSAKNGACGLVLYPPPAAGEAARSLHPLYPLHPC